MLIYIVIGLVAAGVAGFFFLAFLLSGGFERWSAERETAARGMTASEPHAAPGYTKLLVPKGWQRDTYSEIFERIGEGSTGRGEPRMTVKLNGPDETILHLALGHFAHAGGTSFSATATLYTRLSAAPPWTAAMGANGQSNPHEPGWEPISAPDGTEAFIIRNSAPQTKGVRVLVNAPAKRSRIEIRTTAEVYTQDQAVASAASILASIEIDDAALGTALEQARAKQATEADAARASTAAIERILDLATPLVPGVNDIGGGSVLWYDDALLQAYIRLGAEPLNGRTPAEVAASLKVEDARVNAIARPGNREKSIGASSTELVAAFVRDDSLVLWNIELGQEIAVASLDSALEGQVARTLPSDAVAIYRRESMPVTDTGFVERWFTETHRLANASKVGQPLWRPK